MSESNFVKWWEGLEIKDLHTDQKKIIDLKFEATLLCKRKENNPNYLAIVHANKAFRKIFNIGESSIIGENYDFIFDEIDPDYSSRDQSERVRLVRAIKNFEQCSVIICISSTKPDLIKSRFEITFTPKTSSSNDLDIFTFKPVENDDVHAQHPHDNSELLDSLERSLSNERLLREINSLIISDSPIGKIAQGVAEILGEYLRVDRCLIHDYRDNQTNFIAEYCSDYTKSNPMFKGVDDEKSLEEITQYINFQNHFYEKFGDKVKKSWASAIQNLDSDHNFSSISPILKKNYIASQIATTTTFNGLINGGIYIHQAKGRNWLFDEIELVCAIADQFSIALDRSVSIERVMIANHALLTKTLQLKESLKHEREMRKIQSEFVALVSHEFKTPLQIIDSTRELMVRKIKSHNIADEALDKALDRIKSGIQRMNGLIHSTLNLAKLESDGGSIKLESEVFNLRNFVLEIIEKNSNLALNKKIKIVTKLNELPTEFNGDQKLLDHSITNVISNAIKYSQNNSTVKIFAKSSDKKVALRVIDQGIGIPKSDLVNVGRKFFRAKNTLSVAGSGIGLYLAKHFVELHGGEITIESEVDVGTSVTITLPKEHISSVSKN